MANETVTLESAEAGNKAERWCTFPLEVWETFVSIADPKERRAAVLTWLKVHPEAVTQIAAAT